MDQKTEAGEVISSLIETAEALKDIELTDVDPQPPFQDRLTVVDKVYHQPRIGETTCCEMTFERYLDSRESVYSRKMRADKEWKLLRFGWLTDEDVPVGMLVIRNDEGTHLQRNLSEEEKVALEGMTLEVGFHDLPMFVVPHGESMRAAPSGQDLYVRCFSGECSFTVFAFPK